MTSPAIETNHLRKVFKGDKVAVDDLTITVERGEVFGFLGPNGAGKTTSVKMLLGLITPTSGEGKLLDTPLKSVSTRAKVGFLPEHFRFHDWTTGGEIVAGRAGWSRDNNPVCIVVVQEFTVNGGIKLD